MTDQEEIEKLKKALGPKMTKVSGVVVVFSKGDGAAIKSSSPNVLIVKE